MGRHPVRGRSVKLPVTGQHRCYATDGKARACVGTGQDGDPIGCCMAVNAFCDGGRGCFDPLTGLIWYRPGRLKNLENGVNWEAALNCLAELNATLPPDQAWRLPNINELESLVDSDRDQPALPDAHPFLHPGDVYGSSTTMSASSTGRGTSPSPGLQCGRSEAGGTQWPGFHTPEHLLPGIKLKRARSNAEKDLSIASGMRT